MWRVSGRLAFNAFILLAMALGTARASDFGDLAPNIVNIQLFGQWTEDDAKGYYRGVVTVPEPGKSTFTLQWIEVDAEGKLSKVRHSLPVPEVGEVDGIVTGYRSEEEQGGTVVFIDISPDPNAIEDTYVLFVEGPGTYVFEGASN